MFKTGDTILYSSTGICTITEICEKDLGGIKKKYYVLKPVSQNNSTVFVPVDNEKLTSKMRRVLTRDEICKIIRDSAKSPEIWIDDDNERRETFSSIISSGDREKLIIMIRSLYKHQQQQLANGRKFHIADSKIFKEAERLLNDELSWTLGIEPDEVVPFIEKEIEKTL